MYIQIWILNKILYKFLQQERLSNSEQNEREYLEFRDQITNKIKDFELKIQNHQLLLQEKKENLDVILTIISYLVYLIIYKCYAIFNVYKERNDFIVKLNHYMLLYDLSLKYEFSFLKHYTNVNSMHITYMLSFVIFS